MSRLQHSSEAPHEEKLQPHEIARSLGRIVDVIAAVEGQSLRERYRDAWGYKTDPSWSADVGRKTRGLSKPTESVVVGQEVVRHAVEEAGRAIQEARRNIELAADRMRFVFRGPFAERNKSLLVSPEELAEAKRAKRRRDLEEELKALDERRFHLRRELG